MMTLVLFLVGGSFEEGLDQYTEWRVEHNGNSYWGSHETVKRHMFESWEDILLTISLSFN